MRCLVLLASVLCLASDWPMPGQPAANPPPGQVTHTFPFSNSGGAWGGGSWVAPTPTLDCDADTFAGGATWPCTGATLTKASAPTSGNASPYYPAGYSAAGQSAVYLDGVDDQFTAADVAHPAGDFSQCFAGRVDDTGNSHTLVTSDVVAGGSVWTLRWNAGTGQLEWSVYKAGGVGVALQTGALAMRHYYVLCCGYDFTADGNSAQGCNLNGTATASAVANGPPDPAAATFSMGATAAGAEWTGGVVVRWTHWDGVAFTAAQRRHMVLGYMGLLGSAGEEVSLTRATASTVEIGTTGTTMFHLGAGHPQIQSAGLGVWAQVTNYIIQSEAIDNAAWTDIGTPVVTANVGAAPDGATTADRIEDDDGAAAEGRSNVAGCGTAVGTYTFSCYMKAGTLSTATIRISTDGTGTAQTDVTGLDATWQRKSVTVTVGGAPTTVDGQIYPGRLGTVADVGTVDWSSCDCTPTGTLHPHIPTAGAAVQRNADAATIVGNLGREGAACATWTKPAAWATAQHALIGSTSVGEERIYINQASNAYVFDDGSDSDAVAVVSGSKACGVWGAGGKMGPLGPATTSTFATAFDGSMGTGIQFGNTVSGGIALNGWLKTACLVRTPSNDRQIYGVCP